MPLVSDSAVLGSANGGAIGANVAGCGTSTMTAAVEKSGPGLSGSSRNPVILWAASAQGRIMQIDRCLIIRTGTGAQGAYS